MAQGKITYTYTDEAPMQGTQDVCEAHPHWTLISAQVGDPRPLSDNQGKVGLNLSQNAGRGPPFDVHTTSICTDLMLG